MKGMGKAKGGARSGSSPALENHTLVLPQKIWGTDEAQEELARLCAAGCWKCNWADCIPSTKGRWNRPESERCHFCNRPRAEAKNPPDASVGPQKYMRRLTYAEAAKMDTAQETRPTTTKGLSKGGSLYARKEDASQAAGKADPLRSGSLSATLMQDVSTGGGAATSGSLCADAREALCYPEKEVNGFWSMLRDPPSVGAVDPEVVIQKQLGGGKLEDNKVLITRVDKAQKILEVCLECDGEEAKDTLLARQALEAAKKDLAKATKTTPLNMHSLNSAKESYLSLQVSVSERRIAGKEKAAKRADDAVAALQAHLMAVTGEIKAIQEKQAATAAAWASHQKEQDAIRDKVVLEFQKKASEAHNAALQLQRPSAHIQLGNEFGPLVEEVEDEEEDAMNSDLEEEVIPSVVEAHRQFQWDPALFTDLGEHAKRPGPLLFLQELYSRVSLWSQSSAMVVTYGELLNGFSNGDFAFHLLTLKEILGGNWALIYPNTTVTESTTVPLLMRTVLTIALAKIHKTLSETGETDVGQAESFQTVLGKLAKKKVTKKKQSGSLLAKAKSDN